MQNKLNNISRQPAGSGEEDVPAGEAPELRPVQADHPDIREKDPGREKLSGNTGIMRSGQDKVDPFSGSRLT